MHGPNNILTIYVAPKDKYTFENFKRFHNITKRRWKTADILGAEEAKIIENNRRLSTNYGRVLKVQGWWSTNRKYHKQEKYYQDVVGNPYHDYWKRFVSNTLDWWGTGGKFTKKQKSARNKVSVPNSPMFDVGLHLDNNSVMEKIYVEDMSYEDAMKTTFRGRSIVADIITSISEWHKEHGMDDDDAYYEAMRMGEIVQRNQALKNNSPLTNEYAYMLNYYNKYIDEKIREMLKININFHFLKELLKHNPNMGLYVLGPMNRMMRIQGMVGSREKNVVIAMSADKEKIKYEFVYSVSEDHLIYTNEDGFVKAKYLKRDKQKIKNMMYGNRSLKVQHRYNSEYMYDLILEGPHKINPYFDALHNVHVGLDYTTDVISGKDIIC